MKRFNFQDKKIAIPIMILSITLLIVGIMMFQPQRYDLYYGGDNTFNVKVDPADVYIDARSEYTFQFTLAVDSGAPDYMQNVIRIDSVGDVIIDCEFHWDAMEISDAISWGAYESQPGYGEWCDGEFTVLSGWTLNMEDDPASPDHHFVVDPGDSEWIIIIPIYVTGGSGENLSPTAPTIVNLDTDLDAGGATNFTWSISWQGGGDLDGYIDSWGFQFSTDTTFSNNTLLINKKIASEGGTDVGSIRVYVTVNGNYYARIRIFDNMGATSEWSDIIQFRVTGIVPPDDGGGDDGGEDPGPVISDPVDPLEALIPFIVIGVAALIITIMVVGFIMARKKQQRESYYGGYGDYGGGY